MKLMESSNKIPILQVCIKDTWPTKMRHMMSRQKHPSWSPTIVYLDDDSDPPVESDLSVNSEIFDSEPEDKSNFTKVLREISNYKNKKNRKCEGNQDKNKRTHETAFSAKCNAESIN